MIDCKDKLISQILPKEIINDRFLIGKPLHNGEQGWVFDVYDLKHLTNDKD